MASSNIELQGGVSPTLASPVNIRPLIATLQQQKQPITDLEAQAWNQVQHALDQLARALRRSGQSVGTIFIASADIGDLTIGDENGGPGLLAVLGLPLGPTTNQPRTVAVIGTKDDPNPAAITSISGSRVTLSAPYPALRNGFTVSIAGNSGTGYDLNWIATNISADFTQCDLCTGFDNSGLPTGSPSGSGSGGTLTIEYEGVSATSFVAGDPANPAIRIWANGAEMSNVPLTLTYTDTTVVPNKTYIVRAATLYDPSFGIVGLQIEDEAKNHFIEATTQGFRIKATDPTSTTTPPATLPVVNLFADNDGKPHLYLNPPDESSSFSFSATDFIASSTATASQVSISATDGTLQVGSSKLVLIEENSVQISRPSNGLPSIRMSASGDASGGGNLHVETGTSGYTTDYRGDKLLMNSPTASTSITLDNTAGTATLTSGSNTIELDATIPAVKLNGTAIAGSSFTAQAKPTDASASITGAATGTYGSNEQGLINSLITNYNKLRTMVDAMEAKLEASGLFH